MNHPVNFKGWSIVRLAPIFLLILLIAIGAVPGYLQGKWSWKDIPQVKSISQIKTTSKKGLNLTGWKTISKQEVPLGAHKWLEQKIQKDNLDEISVLIKPQPYYKDKPEVEWMDINGSEHWKTDSYTTLNFTVPQDSRSAPVTARFFRAWQKQTVAVVQWYAWPTGGHFDTGTWFWSDRMAQLQGNRLPWIAVCLKIPMEPLGDLNKVKPLAESLAQEVQRQLLAEPFKNQLVK